MTRSANFITSSSCPRLVRQESTLKTTTALSRWWFWYTHCLPICHGAADAVHPRSGILPALRLGLRPEDPPGYLIIARGSSKILDVEESGPVLGRTVKELIEWSWNLEIVFSSNLASKDMSKDYFSTLNSLKWDHVWNFELVFSTADAQVFAKDGGSWAGCVREVVYACGAPMKLIDQLHFQYPVAH